MLEPTLQESCSGHAEVRQVIRVPKVGPSPDRMFLTERSHNARSEWYATVWLYSKTK